MSVLTTDHKPSCKEERKRIKEAGGSIYQIKIPGKLTANGKPAVGPHRVVPGKLSVSRTIGDAQAKLSNFGGNPKVVIPDPDVYLLTLGVSDDFIILGSIPSDMPDY